MKHLLCYLITLLSFQYSLAGIDFIDEEIGFQLTGTPSLDEIHLATRMVSLDDFEDAGAHIKKLLKGDINPDAVVKPRKRFNAKFFEASSAFTIDSPISKYTKNYLTDFNRIKNITPLLSNSIKVDKKEVQSIISDQHYLNRRNKLKSHGYYIKAQLDLPSDGTIGSIIQEYLESRDLKPSEDGSYNIRTLSEYKIYDERMLSKKMQNFILASNQPYINSPVKAMIRQHLFFADHIIRYARVNVFFYELPNKQTLITTNLAIALNNKILQKIPQGDFIALKGIPFSGVLGCNACMGLESLTEKALLNLKTEFSK